MAKLKDIKKSVLSAERKILVDELNEFGSNEILIHFNNFLNGSLDEQVNLVLNEWSNEEFKEFIDYLKKQK